MDKAQYSSARQKMVDEQLIGRAIRDERVLTAMREIEREKFVDARYRNKAYEDRPLVIGKQQTISQPYMVALMTQLLELSGHEKVLEIGTGSGYQAAVLAKLVREVHSVERIRQLANKSKQLLQDLHFTNVHVHLGDGSSGWPEEAPYDGIIVTAAAPSVPKPLLDQMGEGASLVIPVGHRGRQFLKRWRRRGDKYESEDFSAVAFVPLIGAHGWEA